MKHEIDRRWGDLADQPAANIIEQPSLRGTAAGILLPLLVLADRDPRARLLVMPSDHHVAELDPFAEATEHALECVEDDDEHTVLLGISPDSADTEYGWIVPEEIDSEGRLRVRSFVEKCITIAIKGLAGEAGAVEFESKAERGSEEWKAWRKSDTWRKWADARSPGITARRRVYAMIRDKQAVEILFSRIAPRFTEREGGYTRIMRLAKLGRIGSHH